MPPISPRRRDRAEIQNNPPPIPPPPLLPALSIINNQAPAFPIPAHQYNHLPPHIAAQYAALPSMPMLSLRGRSRDRVENNPPALHPTPDLAAHQAAFPPAPDLAAHQAAFPPRPPPRGRPRGRIQNNPPPITPPRIPSPEPPSAPSPIPPQRRRFRARIQNNPPPPVIPHWMPIRTPSPSPPPPSSPTSPPPPPPPPPPMPHLPQNQDLEWIDPVIPPLI
ncbi:hypothetical protein BDQ12DRAFT_720616 [Crucibulum laeve]|uniref:Uncharacterized protein n=1 Tax=Crucibulum laeve TaxID=68775 RepID=A0A5C3MA89_9AGAR|nr:hypothetical protein BDQ12DRAFT_720616 [Crucibulum laeve]